MWKVFALTVLFFTASPAWGQENIAPTPEVEMVTSKRMFSDEEIALLQQLDQRRIELDRREEALRVREKLVDLAQSRLDSRVERLAKLETNIETLLENLSKKEDKELETLSDIYEEMKPDAAANILNNLDDEIVYDLFKRVGRKETAAIMERMNPRKARIISHMLATRSDLPDL